jgi:hypothetical protein
MTVSNVLCINLENMYRGNVPMHNARSHSLIDREYRCYQRGGGATDQGSHISLPLTDNSAAYLTLHT